MDYQVSRDRDRSTSRTYKAIVFYEYEVQGNKYTSDKLRNIEFYSSNRGAAYRTAHKYPVGKEVNVHYNPTDAADSLLEPGVYRSDERCDLDDREGCGGDIR